MKYEELPEKQKIIIEQMKKTRIRRVRWLLKNTDDSYQVIADTVTEEFKEWLGKYTKQSVMNVNKKYKVRNK